MKIGLYSKLARHYIVKVRDIIKARKLSPNKSEMIRLRNEIIESSDNTFNSLQNFGDFYSLSELRDLLFHVQEHRFTIPEISEILDKLGLDFMGFELSDKMTTKAFEAAYPGEGAIYELEKWHEYEKLNPTVFSGMYQFWLQKL